MALGFFVDNSRCPLPPVFVSQPEIGSEKIDEYEPDQ